MPTKKIVYVCNECKTCYNSLKKAENCETQGRPVTFPIGTFFRGTRSWSYKEGVYLIVSKIDPRVSSRGHKKRHYMFEFRCDPERNGKIYDHNENIMFYSFPNGSFEYKDGAVRDIKRLSDSGREDACREMPIFEKALELILEGVDPIDPMKKIQRERDRRRKRRIETKIRERRA